MRTFLILIALVLAGCGSEEQTQCFTFTPTGQVFDQHGKPVPKAGRLVEPLETTTVCE